MKERAQPKLCAFFLTLRGRDNSSRCDTLPEVQKASYESGMPLFKRTLSEFLFRRFMLKHYASNLLVDMNLEAKRTTLDYIKANMVDAPYFEKHPALVRYALQQVDKEGLYMEFGVGRGKSMRWIAAAVDQPVHGFDSNDHPDPVAFLH